ncbi:MAG: ThiF family adenylyltransferase [Desulfovibrionaceae bacterium]
MAPAPELADRVRALAEPRRRPDGAPYASLGLDAVRALAEETDLPPREVEAAACRTGVVVERYVRNLDSVSLADQARLLEARVLLVGLGGLGGHVLDMLCRMGVGRITAADGDVFEASNLNRQLLSTQAGLSQPKAQAALDHALAVNESVDVTVLHAALDAAAFVALAAEADLVVDALGGLADRRALQEAAAAAGKPLVTAAVAGFSGIVATVFPGEPGPAQFLGSGGGAEDALGCPAPGVVTAAGILCGHAANVLTGRATTGAALLFDLADNTFTPVAW